MRLVDHDAPNIIPVDKRHFSVGIVARGQDDKSFISTLKKTLYGYFFILQVDRHSPADEILQFQNCSPLLDERGTLPRGDCADSIGVAQCRAPVFARMPMSEGNRIDGKAAHRVRLGNVKLPNGDTVETVEFFISTPVGDMSLHMSPSVAADMAVEMSRVALDIAKREQAREMSEHVDILDMIREVLKGTPGTGGTPGKAH